MLRIGLVDDHKLFRKSLAALIAGFGGITVVLEAENGIELLELLKETDKVDLLLLDIEMSGMNGFETCMHLRKDYPDIKILIVSQLATKESIHSVMELGAHGFFSKNSDPEQLQFAIQSINDKDFYFGQELGYIIKEAILWEKKKIISPVKLLSNPVSNREIEIIKLASKGFTNSEISGHLFIDIRTVETHRKRIMEKTSSKNFICVILFALRHGIIIIDDL